MPAALSPTPPGLPLADERTVIEAVLRAAVTQSDAFHHEARAFRNRLVIMTLIALGSSACMVVLQWRLDGAEIVRPPGTGAEHLARWATLLLVMVFGAIGALISAIPSASKIPRVRSPFNFPLQQALLKIVLGSLTAIVGVVVTGSSGVTNGYGSLQSLIGVAVVFGASQQAVTQFLDKRATAIIDAAPGPS
ncbi:MAG: hypothetical protein JWN46_989 [Acidimicrobiales bacterium]|nr:hypothetical protein [Acidimicrobiales bacterium]